MTSLPNAADSVSVTLLYVYSTIDGGEAGTERLGDQMGRSDSIETISQLLTDSGLAVETREEEGDIGDTILSVAREENPDVIVMAG